MPGRCEAELKTLVTTFALIGATTLTGSLAKARPCEVDDFKKFTGNYQKSFAICSGIKGLPWCQNWKEIGGGRLEIAANKPTLGLFLDSKKIVVPGRKDNRLYAFRSADKNVDCSDDGLKRIVSHKTTGSEASLVLDGEFIKFKHRFEIKVPGGVKFIEREVGLLPLK